MLSTPPLGMPPLAPERNGHPAGPAARVPGGRVAPDGHGSARCEPDWGNALTRPLPVIGQPRDPAGRTARFR